jgi:hypothetical protein
MSILLAHYATFLVRTSNEYAAMAKRRERERKLRRNAKAELGANLYLLGLPQPTPYSSAR